MSRNYQLDPKAAAEAGQGSKIVNEAGLYSGVIKFAWGSTNDRGTEAVHVIVDCDNGQILRQDFWTYDAKGEPLPSFKMVNALMTCVSTRTLTPTRGAVTRYDYDAKQDMPFMEDTYPELMGKRAVFAVQMEAYEGNDKKERTRPNVVGVYDATTRQSAAEKLAKPPMDARSIDSMAAWLERNPVKQAKPRATAAPQQRTTPAQGATTVGFDDDDIPF